MMAEVREFFPDTRVVIDFAVVEHPKTLVGVTNRLMAAG